MNNFLLAVLMLISTATFTSVQAQEIDPRVLDNYGEKAQTAYKYNKSSYNYMIYELDHGYEVVTTNSLTKDQQKQIQNPIQWTAEQIASLGTNQFNYIAMGLKLQSATRQYIRISKEQVLVLYAIREVTTAFSTSPLNTK